ncbi:MAG TPA: threonylcarbamoyl-AMP synthase [Armatimonadetes bacterium]|nr:threonylcarbamoyl-AMP synthase [Armatimonadota bacterium]
MSGPAVISVARAGVEAAASAAAEALEAGGLVVLPTDTVYGLAASLRRPDAIRAVFAAKRRPEGMALPVLVASPEDAERLVPGALDAHDAVLRRWWPGALTVIVPASAQLPPAVTAGRTTVGLREPDHPVAVAILHAAGGALAVTSANISGDPSAREIADLPEELLHQVAVVIDAGRCPGGTASTVLDLAAHPPRVLREGAIPASSLREFLPDLVG